MSTDERTPDALALALYEAMGGVPSNWSKETQDFRDQYLKAALSAIESAGQEPVSDMCGNCGTFTWQPRHPCPCDRDDCPIGAGFVCSLCAQSIRRNVAHRPGSTQ